MRVSEFKRELRQKGCYPVGGGRHEHWYNPKTGKTAPVSRHNSEELKTGTEKSIRKMLGI